MTIIIFYIVLLQMPKKYIINPITNRPIELYGKKWEYLVKRNILKNKIIDAPVIQFDKK